MNTLPIPNKLSDRHVVEIARHAALGMSQAQIQQALAHGIVTDTGDTLQPVCVSRQAVQQRLATPEVEAQRRSWMRRLYGDLYVEPAAYPGERLRRLEKLYRQAKKLTKADQPVATQLRAIREARALIGAMTRLVGEAEAALKLTANRDGVPRADGGQNKPVSAADRTELIGQLLERLRLVQALPPYRAVLPGTQLGTPARSERPCPTPPSGG